MSQTAYHYGGLVATTNVVNGDSGGSAMPHEAEALEALHGAAALMHRRVADLEARLAASQAECDTLRQRDIAHSHLREELADYQRRCKQLEAGVAQLTAPSDATRAYNQFMAATAPGAAAGVAGVPTVSVARGADTNAQLSVQVRAYQRHNQFLQGEVHARDATIRGLQARLDAAQDIARTQEERMALVMAKLRAYNQHAAAATIGAAAAAYQRPKADAGFAPLLVGSTQGSSGALIAAPPAGAADAMGLQLVAGGGAEGDGVGALLRVSVPETAFASIKERMAAQAATVQALRERLEAAEEEAARRDELLQAVRKENATLKQTVTRLIGQLTADVEAAVAAPPTGAPSSHSVGAAASPPRITAASQRGAAGASTNLIGRQSPRLHPTGPPPGSVAGPPSAASQQQKLSAMRDARRPYGHNYQDDGSMFPPSAASPSGLRRPGSQTARR
jgi:hypothetical protein